MAVKPLSQDEVIKMRKSCQLAARGLVYVAPFIKAGISTNELDKLVHEFFLTHGATSAPLGYHGFPKSICTSINDVICHGVPDEQILKNGDIINVDVTCILDGFYGDTSKTYFVGEVSDKAKMITQIAEECMNVGIEEVGPGKTTGDIGFAINKHATRHGYTTVKEIGGHGIGRKFHDEPFVPSFGKKGKGEVLVPWQCITVEPMLNESNIDYIEVGIKDSNIKWYKTGDGSLSAQFEHTVLVTDTGYEILTLV